MSDPGTEIALRKPTEIVLLPTIKAEAAYAPGGIDGILENLAKKVRATPVDISTKEGREACASFAFQIARSKTALDDMGAALTEEWRKRTNAVNADRRKVREFCDSLKAEFRAPLTQYEEAEKSRVAGHETALRELEALCQNIPLESALIAERMAKVDAYDNRNWQEFANRAGDMLFRVRSNLQQQHLAALNREEEALELANLRAAEKRRQEQAAERDRLDREKRIADEAAAQATRRAQEEAAAALRRAEDEAAAANERAAQAERDRQAARIDGHKTALQTIRGMIEDACSPFNDAGKIRYIVKIFDRMPELARNFEEFADEAAALIANGRKQIAARLAEEQEKEEVRQAARDLINEPAAQAPDRPKDPAPAAVPVDRRQAINRAIVAAIAKFGVPEPTARDLVRAIIKGEIENLSVTYS